MFDVDPLTFQTDGYVSISWDQAGIDPDFYSWRVYRRTTGDILWTLLYETTDDQPNLYEIKDWLALPNVQQEWALTQVTVDFPDAPQVEGPYETVQTTPYSEDYWLIHPTDEAFNTRLHHVTSHQDSDNYEQATIQLIDRGNHVEQGTNFGETGTLSCKMADRPDITARQQREKVELIKASYSEVWLRTPFGSVKQVALGQLSFDREAGVGLREHGTLSVPYTEVR